MLLNPDTASFKGKKATRGKAAFGPPEMTALHDAAILERNS